MAHNRHHKLLELDKVLSMLAEECSCAESAERAMALEPSGDAEQVRALLAESWDAYSLIGRYGSPNFGGVKNVSNPLRRAQAGGGLSMIELLRIAEVLRIIRSLREWRGRCEGTVTSFDSLFMSLIPNKFLEEKITNAIIGEDEISDSASHELADIRKRKARAQSKVRDILDKMVHSQSYQKYLQDPIVTLRSGRFVVPVKAECRSNVPGLVHDTSSSGATVFVEPMAAVEANNEIKVLESKEAAEIDRILLELSSQAGDFADSICSGYEVLLELDLIFAKGRLGYTMRASLPEVNDEGIILFNKARHPLINKDTVVATDIRLGETFDTLMITGPNTGGKTVTLKTIGLLTLMAGCGLLLPTGDQSRVSVFDRVLADIGDEQSIEQSLSTFSSHMKNIIEIIGSADEKSLILIDELGAGTDPIEGAALATSIIEQLRTTGARLAVTTHYAELKSYALSTPGVENGSCEFDVATLKPTYRLLIGVPGRSNAFAISERLGIPHDIVDRARQLVSSDSVKFEDVIEALEQSRQKMEAESEQAMRLKTEARIARDEAKQLKDTVERDREKLLEKARGDAMRIVSQAKAQAQQLSDEIDEMRRELRASASAEAGRSAKSKLKKSIGQLEELADPIVDRRGDDEDYVLPRPLKKGDNVMIVDIGKRGVVTRDPDSSGNVEVQAGMIKTRVKINNLRLVEGNQGGGSKGVRPIPRQQQSSERKLVSDAVTEIDVRGMNVDEASIEIDKAIDCAVLRSLHELRVIHGKGTGALRAGLHQHFRRHPNIKSFRLGVYGEGEAGVTIIELK